MALLSWRLPFALVASLGVLTVHESAYACAVEAPVHWNPQRSWPAACETNVATDGLVLLEGDALPAELAADRGELEVTLARTVEGVPLETFAGALSFPDATTALFKSASPLAPNTDYLITARRLSPEGRELAAPFTSKFTTGASALAPIAFGAAASLELEHFDKELEDCARDSCGIERCAARDQTVPATYVRVAIPAIEGGVEQRPYAVTATLTLGAEPQAAALATSDTAATQARRRSFAVIEVPTNAYGRDGCVTVTATDLAGQRATSAPICLRLEAPDPQAASAEGATHEGVASPAQPATEAGEPAPLFSSHIDAVSAGVAANTESAGGCSVAGHERNARGLGWLLLVLGIARLRSRKASY